MKTEGSKTKMFDVTDDFKIMTNRAIQALKNKQQLLFESSVKYIFKELQTREQDDYVKYLYFKIRDNL